MTFESHIPTRIIFGPGTFERLGSEPLPGSRALVVTTAGTAARGLADKTLAHLKKQGISAEVYAGVLPNPELAGVDEAAALARRRGCDFVLGLGGGSALDSAKGAALAAANGGSLWDYCPRGTGKGKPVLKAPLPLVTVSTTASTGTEINPIFVISNSPAREKIGMRFPPLTFPLLSIVDPELTLSIPPQATAFQGCDILFHAAEGYHSKMSTPLSRMYSLEAIKIAAEALPRAVKDGSNLEARTRLAEANLLSGMVLASSSMASAHSLEHGLSGLCRDLPHGAGLIMLCLPFYRFWAEKTSAAGRLAELAAAFGEDTKGLSPGEAALKLADAFQKMFQACGVDGLKMSAYGLSKDSLPLALEGALVAAGGAFNLDPEPLPKEAALGLLQKAWA